MEFICNLYTDQFFVHLFHFPFFNTVALAKLLFPTEAKVNTDIAHVEGTPEFSPAKVDLNESPFIMKEEHLTRLRALSKTGRRLNTNCIPICIRLIYIMMCFQALAIILWNCLFYSN